VFVRFTTSTTVPENAPPNVDVTLEDLSTVHALYKETLDLPAIAAGAMGCPLASGVVYHLTFSGGCGAERCAPPRSSARTSRQTAAKR
jgi:hypothetical protein